MHAQVENTAAHEGKSTDTGFSGSIGAGAAMQFKDNRPEAVAQRQTQAAANNSPQVQALAGYQASATAFSTEGVTQRQSTGAPMQLNGGGFKGDAKGFIGWVQKQKAYLANTIDPKEKCEAARGDIGGLLTGGNEKIPLDVVGMLIWSKGSKSPGNHYVVVAKVGGQEVAIDPTAGQFGGGPICDFYTNWHAAFVNKAEIRNKKVRYVKGDRRAAKSFAETFFFGAGTYKDCVNKGLGEDLFDFEDSSSDDFSSLHEESSGREDGSGDTYIPEVDSGDRKNKKRCSLM